MFIRLAAQIGGLPNGTDPGLAEINQLFELHPNELLAYLEDSWSQVAWPAGAAFGVPGAPNAAEVAAFRDMGRPQQVHAKPAASPPPGNMPGHAGAGEFLWPHLIYAYLLENTRLVDIFRRVLSEMLHGERFGPPTANVQRWLRASEDLFFSDRLGTWLFPPTSQLRPDGDAIRRNAYQRLFGSDLIHGTEDGRPYPYVRSEAANRQFVPMFESLLREVWRGYVNRNNQYTSNTTDDAAILDLVLQLRDMLHNRRIGGALAREEFYAVAMLAWFHATVTHDNDVMLFLKSRGSNAGDRLRAVGERVGLPAHSRSYHFFQLAPVVSELLTNLEADVYSNLANVPQLYAANSPAVSIIHHWSVASGKNLKELVGAPAASSALAAPAAG